MNRKCVSSPLHPACAAVLLGALAGSVALAEPPNFRGLGGLHVIPGSGGVLSWASGVSADGSTVVGTSADNLARIRPFRWRLVGGMRALSDPAVGAPATYHDTGGTSADGAIATGTVWSPSSCPTAARWSELLPPVVLGTAACNSAAFAASASGAIVVGEIYTPSASVAMAWTTGSDTATLLSTLPGFREATARGISDDGSLIVGSCFGTTGSQALVWEHGALTPRGLGYLPNTERNRTGRALAVSPDGSHIVGESSSTAAGAGGIEGFIYALPAGPMIGLGPASGGQQTSPTDVCDRGEVVVGSVYLRDPPFTQTAFIWTRAQGLRDLKAVLETDHSLDLTGWHLTVATGISADGSVIVGTGEGPHGTEAWRAVIPPIPEPCIADFNHDGGVDGSDVAAFFIAWMDADPSTDANRDGGVDGGDLEAFFVPWEAGGCN